MVLQYHKFNLFIFTARGFGRVFLHYIIFIWIAVSTIVREIIKCSLRVVVYINSKLLLVNTHQMYIRSIHCTIINYNSNETTSVKAIRRASFIWGFIALKYKLAMIQSDFR